MAHSHTSPYTTTAIVIIMVLGLSTAAENTTNPNDLITDSPNTTQKTLALNITTIPPSGNQSVLPTSAPLFPASGPLQDQTDTSTEKPPDKTSIVLTKIMAPAAPNIPPDCSQRSKNHKQPQTSSASRWRRCCPNGENLVLEDDSSQSCQPQTMDLNPKIISVELYHNCIEDLEEDIELQSEEGNPCDDGSIYSAKTGDQIMVIQDGTLLIMDSFSNQSYTVESKYCLASFDDGEIYAVVCHSSTENHLNRGQTILFTCFMIASIPCLCVVSYLHFAIKQLRSVHGLSLGVMSTCMAIGFTLHVIAEISKTGKSGIGYLVQFFMLAYFYWVFCLCVNVVLHVWYYLPKNILITRSIRYTLFISYNVLAFSIPFGLVLVTYLQGLPGMPSYFYQGFTESIRDSQRYFIPPVTCVLILCFVLLVAAFFGFKRLEKLKATYAAYKQVSDINEATTPTEVPIPVNCLDIEGYGVIKKDAKCITCLYLITIITWIFEVVTFYSPGPDDFNAFMEIINASQGVLILMIFIIVRRRRNAISSWWHDRGSHEITPIPMKDMSAPKQITENGTEANS